MKRINVELEIFDPHAIDIWDCVSLIAIEESKYYAPGAKVGARSVLHSALLVKDDDVEFVEDCLKVIQRFTRLKVYTKKEK